MAAAYEEAPKARPAYAKSVLAAIAVLALGLLAAYGAVRYVANDAARDAHERLDRLANRVRLTIEQRIRTPIYGLNGLAASIGAHGDLTRAEYARFVALRNLPLEFPGVRGFGYAERVANADSDAFVARMRADGRADFAIRTQDHPGDMYVVRDFEPLAPNGTAIGFDIAANLERRAAIEAAVDNGVPVLTQPVKFLQAPDEPRGYLLFVPLYRGGAMPATTEQRREAVRGVLYVPIFLSQMLSGVADSADGKIEFDLSDGWADRIFSYRAPDSPFEGGLASSDRAYTFFLPINVAGRLFVVRAWPTAAGYALIDRRTPVIALAVVGTISVIAAFAVWLLLTSRERALALARSMTVELDRLAKVAERTTNGVVIAGPDRRIVWVNEGFTRLTGYTMEDAVGRSPRDLVGYEGTSRESAGDIRRALAEHRAWRGEIRNRAKDGRIYWVDLEIRPTTDHTGAFSGFLAIQSDITERHDAYERLEESEAELRRALVNVEEERSRVEQQAMELAALAEQLAGERQKSVEAHERLREAVESLSDAFCLFDPGGRIVMYNAKYLEPFGRMADLVQPGVSFELVVRIGLEAGLYPEAAGREDEYVAERVATFSQESPPREAHAPDGKWYRIARLRTPSGHTITSRVDITELKRKEAELAALNAKLEKLASVDPLTGAANRRAFLARAEEELARVQRYRGACALLALDIDHFKRVNDTHGHPAGDAVLVEFARRVARCVRTTDFLGRLGGEEFSILAPGIGPAEAVRLAERVGEAVRATAVEWEGTRIPVTVSIGISAFEPGDKDVSAAQRRADEALYRAKHEGRDRYVIAAAAE